jgi:hypothetical protein
MNTTLVASVGSFLGIATIVLGMIVKWLVANQGTIQAGVAAVKADTEALKTTAATHTDQIAANAKAIHATALLTPIASTAVQTQPTTAQPPIPFITGMTTIPQTAPPASQAPGGEL